MGKLSGKTTIVTGGARGIGLAISKRFHNEGANVVICDILGENLAQASSKIAENGKRVLTLQADVTEERDIETVISNTIEKFKKIDVLVNNAGILRAGKLDQIDPLIWDKIMRTNVYAAWRFMVAVLPDMRRHLGGSIVNIASISAIRAFPDLGLYCTSKAALVMLSQVMALEVAEDNIRINMVLPGLVENTELLNTEIENEKSKNYFSQRSSIHPLGRNAKPKDIADAALYLASDQSEYVTGVLLNVDGGRHMATNKPPGI